MLREYYGCDDIYCPFFRKNGWPAGRQCGVSSGAMEPHSFKLELPQGTTIEAAYWAGLKHIEETLNLKAYADYRPVGSVPHPTMSGMGIWSYSYKA